MWKDYEDLETKESNFDNQLTLPFDERFRRAEQFSFDFGENESPEKSLWFRRLLNLGRR